MRNLKKFLALVLAMVMCLSLMVTANAAYTDYTDTDKIDAAFDESVRVLTGLKVYKGQSETSFNPKGEITRAEVAALIYRMVTGDIDDERVHLYKDYQQHQFTDVPSDSWYAGYVGYCTSSGYIMGKPGNRFDPYGKVTGYEVLAMILRAVGYGKQGEFVGNQWQINVSSRAQSEHVTDTITEANYNYTLNQVANREIVAELLLRASLIPQVTWTSALNYNKFNSALATADVNNYNDSLAFETFGLRQNAWSAVGRWGEPGYTWTADRHVTGTVATIMAAPVWEFYTGDIAECDFAEHQKFDTEKSYRLHVNSQTPVTNTYRIVATDRVTKVGGWGRLVKVYEDISTLNVRWSALNNKELLHVPTDPTNEYPDTIVMIDTYLAKVVDKAAAVLDGNDHVITPARLVVDLYDRDQNATSLRRIISKPSNSKDNWDEFAIGDVISLKGRSGASVVNSGNENWAYQLPNVIAPSNNVLTQNTHVFDLTKLEGVPGKQTTKSWNNGVHYVDGAAKTDDLALRMDKAGDNIDTTFTWFYDQYGYLLGIDDGNRSTYGVITAVYASYNQGEANTTGLAKAIATVLYADGTTGTEEIDYFLVNGTAIGTKAVGNAMNENPGTNVVQLWPSHEISGWTTSSPMYEGTMAYNAATPAPVRGANQGAIFMAPLAVTNTQASINNSAGTNNKHGILNNNLFKFVQSAGDKTVAIEVAGGGNVYTSVSNNSGDFSGHWNVTNSASNAKLYKTLAYIAVRDTTTTAAANATTVAWLDNDTQILLRNPDTGNIAHYNGVDSLPGDITITNGTDSNYAYVQNNQATSAELLMNEIDWADTDGDGRADVVYLTGKVDGITSYNLFYTNDLTATWDGTKATVDGFLNGVHTTLTFTKKAEFDKIMQANASGYSGHLFAVKKIGDIVEEVLEDNSGVALLPTDGSIVNQFQNGKSGTAPTFTGIQGTGADQFMYGADNYTTTTPATTSQYMGTNPYTRYTEAVYFRDYPTARANSWTVVYNPSYNWAQVGADVVATHHDGNAAQDEVRRFHLTPNTKIYGLGSNMVLAESTIALEYLNHSNINWNDVTIVYENNYTQTTADATFSVLELYIQTDPNETPSGTGMNAGSWALPTITKKDSNNVTIGNVGHTGDNGVSYTYTINVYKNGVQVGTRSYTNVRAGTPAATFDVNVGTISSGDVFRADLVHEGAVIVQGFYTEP